MNPKITQVFTTLKSKLSNKKYSLGLLMWSSFWLFLVFYVLQIEVQPFRFPDSKSYELAAENLFYHQKVDPIRPIGIAFINGLPLLFGFPTASLNGWNFVINGIIWILSLQITFKLLNTYINHKVAFGLSIAYSLIIGTLIVHFHFLSEGIFTFLLIVSFYLLRKYELHSDSKYLMFAFAILLFSVFIRPSAKGILLIVFTFYIVKFLKHWKSKSSVLIAIVGFIVGVHLVEMKRNYGNFTLSYIDSFTLYNYLGTRADAISKDESFVQCNNQRFDHFTQLSFPKQKVVAISDFKNQLQNNTFALISAYGTDLFTNTFYGSNALYEYKNCNKTAYFEPIKLVFRAVSKVQNIILTVMGLLLSFIVLLRNKYSKTATIAAYTILYLFFTSGISSEQGDRFHLVFYPLILLLLAEYWKANFKTNTE